MRYRPMGRRWGRLAPMEAMAQIPAGPAVPAGQRRRIAALPRRASTPRPRAGSGALAATEPLALRAAREDKGEWLLPRSPPRLLPPVPSAIRPPRPAAPAEAAATA